MASRKAKLPRQASFLIRKNCKRRKLLSVKVAKLPKKVNERYEDEFPDRRETSYPISTVFLTALGDAFIPNLPQEMSI